MLNKYMINKIRKLLIKPKLFFKDIGKLNAKSIELEKKIDFLFKALNTKKTNNKEDKFKHVNYDSNFLFITKKNNHKIDFSFEKIPNNKPVDFTSIFINFEDTELIHKMEEIGKVKQKNMFILKKRSFDFGFDLNLYEHFRDSEVLRKNLFKDIKNVIVINPKDVIPILILNSNPFINLIVVITELNNDIKLFLNDFKESIGTLVISKDLKKEYTEYNFNNEYILERNSNLYYLLTTILVDNSKKKINMLFPIKYTEEQILNNIDYYNTNPYIDGVVKFKRKTNKNIKTFTDIIEDIEEIEILLLKEEFRNKYKTLIKNKQYKEILKRSIKQGARYEVL